MQPGTAISAAASPASPAFAAPGGVRHGFGKLGARGFETDGIGVGNVVADNVQIFACRIQAREAVLKSHIHLLL